MPVNAKAVESRVEFLKVNRWSDERYSRLSVWLYFYELAYYAGVRLETGRFQ